VIAFRILSAIAKEMDINEGAEVTFHIDGKRLVIEKADKIPKFTHQDLVRALRKTKKGVDDFGGARGKEIPWVTPAEGDIIGIGCRPVCRPRATGPPAGTAHGSRSEGARNDLEVPIPPGLQMKGVVIPHQLRTIDCKARRSEKPCTVPRATFQALKSPSLTVASYKAHDR
jgi:antitoxin component of MazEF toxin-antitoxin module